MKLFMTPVKRLHFAQKKNFSTKLPFIKYKKLQQKTQQKKRFLPAHDYHFISSIACTHTHYHHH